MPLMNVLESIKGLFQRDYFSGRVASIFAATLSAAN